MLTVEAMKHFGTWFAVKISPAKQDKYHHLVAIKTSSLQHFPTAYQHILMYKKLKGACSQIRGIQYLPPPSTHICQGSKLTFLFGTSWQLIEKF